MFFLISCVSQSEIGPERSVVAVSPAASDARQEDAGNAASEECLWTSLGVEYPGRSVSVDNALLGGVTSTASFRCLPDGRIAVGGCEPMACTVNDWSKVEKPVGVEAFDCVGAGDQGLLRLSVSDTWLTLAPAEHLSSDYVSVCLME